VSAELLTRWADQAFTLGLGFALLMLLVEGWWPRVRVQSALGRRWLANLLAYLATILTLRWLPALSMIGAALLAERDGWGLLNSLAAPPVVAIAVSIVAIDLAGYLIHRLEHQAPLLWRIHRLHHSDPDVDVTTTYRFHPFEVLLRAAVSAVVTIGVGVPVIAVAVYQIISTLTSVLSHANVRLPHTLDAAFGWVVITPDIHRTHHSIDRDDSNSNFSVCLSCWDRLFGTFRSAPKHGYDNMVFGTESRTAADGTSLLRMLADPFLPERAPEAFAAAVTDPSVEPARRVG
jgi:sterol desaturase/sphingolipid hydroxylase (fatty acid hydroxylase superfamily)